MNPLPALGLAALLVLAVTCCALLAEARRRERWTRRLAAVLGPYGATEGAPERSRTTAGLRPAARLQAALGLRPERAAELPLPWWAVPVAGFAVAAAAGWMLDLGLIGPALVVPGALLACHVAFGWLEERRRATLYRQFPDAILMIVRAVRIGLPVAEAMRIVAREAQAPTKAEFTQLTDRIAIGHSLEEALEAMARSAGLPEYRFFGTALVLQSQTGGSLTETLDNLAEVIRRRVALRARARALASEARASAIALGTLPVLACLALFVIAPDYIRPLVEDPQGRALAWTAAGLLVCGLLTMRGILRRSLG